MGLGCRARCHPVDLPEGYQPAPQGQAWQGRRRFQRRLPSRRRLVVLCQVDGMAPRIEASEGHQTHKHRSALPDTRQHWLTGLPYLESAFGTKCSCAISLAASWTAGAEWLAFPTCRGCRGAVQAGRRPPTQSSVRCVTLSFMSTNPRYHDWFTTGTGASVKTNN